MNVQFHQQSSCAVNLGEKEKLTSIETLNTNSAKHARKQIPKLVGGFNPSENIVLSNWDPFPEADRVLETHQKNGLPEISWEIQKGISGIPFGQNKKQLPCEYCMGVMVHECL